jgi:hypothetical protein
MTQNSTSASASSIGISRRYRDRSFSEQHPEELDEFIDLLLREGVRSYLEVGSKWGATLWAVARMLPIGSKIVSVDLPNGLRETEPSLFNCVEELRSWGYDAHLFRQDSADERTVEAVRALGPFDAVFIDGNHTLPYVSGDWKRYGPMARMVVFHDIGWLARAERPGKLPIDVPILWKKIKEEAANAPGWRYQEIRRCPRDNGIGVLWTR